MNFFIKTKGSVSIFLIIILVPMIAITTIFIDASRIKLAQGLADSAADLTINTVLTQYDTDLSDYYGLMASCQSMDDFYTVAEGYFEECIVSQGVNPTLAQEFAADIMDIIKGKATINDFMLIDTENTSAEITPVEGANLANPAVIKAQVVEFMKYRAPIDLLTNTDGKKGLYSKLTEVQKHIEVMPAEMDIQNKKMDYYNKENELMKKALDVYKLLKEYEDYITANGLDKDYLETTVKTDMGAVDATKGLIADYKELHRKYVSNWANTKDYTEGIKSVQTRVSAASLGASGGSVSKNDVINGIKNCTKAREAMATALANLNTKLDEITFEDLPEEQINQNQYWVQLHKAIGSEYDTYINKLTAFLKAKNQMEYNYEEGKEQPYTVKEKRTRTVTETVKDPLTGKTVIDKDTGKPKTTTYEEEYEVEVTKYRDITGDDFGGGQTIAGAYESESGSSDAADNYQNERIYEISNRMQTYSDAAFQDDNDNNVKRANADAEIAAALSALEAEYKILADAQAFIEPLLAEDALPKLKKLVGEYHEAQVNWETAVDNNMHHVDDSSIIQRDSEELADMEDKMVKITEDDVDILRQRLENANALLQCYRDTIESIKYRGEVIFGKASYDGLPNAGIKKCEDFDHAAKAIPSGNPAIELKPEHVTQTVLDQYIEDTWEIEENFAGLLEVKDGADGNNPVLHNGIPSTDSNCTSLDKWFHEQFPTNLEELTANLNMLSYLKQMMNQLAETVKGMEGYTNVYLEDTDIKGDFLPSGGGMVNTDDRFNKNEPDYIHDENALETQLESTGASAGDLFKDLNFATLVTEGRDNLYATMYIMNMFSYETSALEGLYELQGGGKDEKDIYKMSDGNKIKPGNAGTYYDTLLKKDPSTTEGDWWNTKKSFHPNKTLTNKMLDKDHCISYGNEVEYILYGDSTENNKTKIELTMALTRFAMNFAPVMDVYWKNIGVIDISNAISTATQGIIPAPLVRLIICMGVCAAESAVDMNYLKAGLPVAFYKSDAENQLFIDLTLDKDVMMTALNDMSLDYVTKNMSVGERSITKSNAAFSYSDYVSVYLFIALCANEDAIYQRTADVIQLNMIENYPELGEYKLANEHTYFSLDANIRVKPLMLELPYAKMCGIEAPEDGAWNTLHSEAVRGY